MAKQKKRIILTGAQGVGKTTLMNALATDGTKTLSIAREQAIEAGWSPETGSSEEYQKKLFAALLKAVSSKRNYVSDRGLSCVAAYTFDGALNGFIGSIISVDRENAKCKVMVEMFGRDTPVDLNLDQVRKI
jgi:predicted ATPase